MLWRNKKTGNLYIIIDKVKNATNSVTGNKIMYLYAEVGKLDTKFVRETMEFEEKFEFVSSTPPERTMTGYEVHKRDGTD